MIEPPEGLQTLLRIIAEVEHLSDLVDLLDQFTARVGEVIPFSKCMVLHERENKGIPRGILYRNSAAPDPSYGRCGLSSCGPAVGIERYASCFAISDRLNHAFRWRDSGCASLDVSPRVAELASHMRGGEGVAASVRSVVAGVGDVVTLLQFECAEASTRQMLLASFTALFLHSTFSLHAVDIDLPENTSGVSLTGKEQDVVKWVVEGKTSWEIGRILSTSERTVKFHLKNVYSKLNVSNRAHAVAVMNRLNLV